jgi:uncharacterized iron-regulated membrane protein
MDNQSIVILALGVSISLFALIGWMIWMDARRRQMNFKAATEFRHKLLDKFGSAAEFIGFIKTNEGQLFLSLPMDGRSTPLDRIIRFVQVGVILAFVGLSLIAGSLATPGPPGVGTVIGGCFAAAGIGAMIAAGISYRLVKKWGLISVAATTAQAPLVNEAKTSDASSEVNSSEAKDASASETESETVPQAKAS